MAQGVGGDGRVAAPPAAAPSGPLSATAEERHASFSDGCMVGFSDAAPPPLASVPEDVLRMLQALKVKNEEETLRRAAAYCDAHAPPISPYRFSHPQRDPVDMTWAYPLFCDVTVHLPYRDRDGKLGAAGADGC